MLEGKRRGDVLNERDDHTRGSLLGPQNSRISGHQTARK